MKKIALTFLLLIMVTPAFANIHINPDTVVAVIKQHVPADKVNPVIREYNAQLKASANGSTRFGIAANRLWNVCAAVGWNIKEPTGKQKCKTFVNALVKSGNVTYKEVCGDDKGKTGATERCVTDFKNVKVNIGPAIAIAKEYALVKYKDGSLQCFNKHRLSWNDDYVKCVSQNSNTYYEFQFDSVTESIDNTIKNGIQRAVCTIHGAPATTAGYVGGGTNVSATSAYVDASCAADATKCAAIHKSIAKFGYAATYENNICKINFETISDRDALRTAFGIDNFVFCAGIQARNNQSTEAYVKQYIASKAGVTATSVKCDAGFKTYTGSGCKANGITDFKDDIKTCHVGDKAIDLVFDDINEDWTTYTNAADQAMGCIVSNGTFSGKRCIGLGEQQCNTLRAANIKSCPECKKVYWDTNTNSCVLPAGASAANLQKGVNIGMIVGGTIAGVAVTVITAGTGGAAVATIVLTGIETVGAGIEITSQLKIDGIADEFLVKSNQCKSESCAEELINDNLQRLARLQGDFSDAEINAIDVEIARLIELIPTNSSWWTKYLKNYDGSSFLASANDNNWEPEQIWRAIGLGMQATSIVVSVGKWIFSNAGFLERTLNRTSRVLLKNAKIAKANIVNPHSLSGEDLEWYKLWQEYAPKNQTFAEFKAMTNNDLNEMKQMSQDWTPRSMVRAKHQAQDRLSQLMDKYEIDAMPDDPKELAELYKKYPDLKTAAEELKTFDGIEAADNYSTFDPEMSRAFKQYNQALKELDDWWNTEYQKELERARSMFIWDFRNSEQVKKLLAQYELKYKAVQKLAPSQWDIAENFSLKNVDNVVNERAREFKDIIDNNPGIKSQLDHWDDLTDVQRSSVAQQITDAYSAKTGTQRTNISLDYNTTAGGYYTPGTSNIVLNPNAQLQSPEGMIEVLAHEHAHLIDDLAPNEGALGAQYSHYGEVVYSNRVEDGYRVALTEQSSYKIGPSTSKEVTGTTDPYLGTEYALEQAKAALKNAQDVATTAVASVPTGLTLGEVAAKTPIKEIIKDNLGTDKEQK